MITKRTLNGTNTVRLTFSLPRGEPAEPVSVVGDFNEWDATAHRLQARSNGRRSVSLVVPRNERVAFRYRTASGTWFDDDSADGYAENHFGGVNCVVET